MNHYDPIRLTTKASNNRLAYVRELMGLTKSAMAKVVGLSATTYGNIENLKVYPSRNTATRIAAALHYEVEYIFPDYLRHVSKTVATTSIPESDVLLSLADREVLQLTTTTTDNTALQEGIDDVLMRLTPKQELVLRKRFALEGGEPMTLAQIAAELGLSVTRVRQIESKALRRLRHPKNSHQLRPYLDEAQ